MIEQAALVGLVVLALSPWAVIVFAWVEQAVWERDAQGRRMARAVARAIRREKEQAARDLLRIQTGEAAQ